MRYEGKFVILTIFGVALIASIGSLWYHHLKSRRVLAFWTAANSVLIARAPEVECLRLAKVDGEDEAAGERIEIGGAEMVIAERKSVTRAQGTDNMRHVLLQDLAFAWPEHPPQTTAWDYALRFVDGDQSTTVVFALESGCVALQDVKQTNQLVPAAVDEFEAFFREQFAVEKTK